MPEENGWRDERVSADDDERMFGFDTLAVHAGQRPVRRDTQAQ